jgi:hypothetical protein
MVVFVVNVTGIMMTMEVWRQLGDDVQRKARCGAVVLVALHVTDRLSNSNIIA